MHPITFIETTVFLAVMILIFVVAWLVPRKARRVSLFLASFLALIGILLFAVRPYWINYQVSVKTEQLNQYLEQKYPQEEWKIKRKIGRQYNPYHLDVRFENEEDWIYTYLVDDDNIICQLSYGAADGQLPKKGKHYESKSCEELL